MIKKFIFLTLILVFIPQTVFAEPVSSSTLIEEAKRYDGQTIVFEGEVIGDVMNRGKHTWINVNDDPYSLNKRGHFGYNSGQSIWVSSDLTKDIKNVGNYFWRGDRVLVKGVFNRVCKIHGGDMDIHAIESRIIKPGHPIKHSFKLIKAITAFVLFAMTILVYNLVTAKRRRRLMTA